MALDAATMPIKFEVEHTTHGTGVTIFEIPGHGLFRTLEFNAGEFTVQTLSPAGWMDLILLNRKQAANPVEALQIWLDIQTPTTVNATDDEGNHDG